MKAPNLHGVQHTLLDLSIVFVGNSEIGYTAFVNKYPEIITEGHTKTESMMNLMGAFHDGIKAGFIKFEE